jgi:hypothetical protein
MKIQSIEWFIDKFEHNDTSLRAAITIPFEDQHKNCRLALEQYCEINPKRVEHIFNQVKEVTE